MTMKTLNYRPCDQPVRYKKNKKVTVQQLVRVEETSEKVSTAIDDAFVVLNEAMCEKEFKAIDVLPAYLFNRVSKAYQKALDAVMKLENEMEEVEKWVSDQTN